MSASEVPATLPAVLDAAAARDAAHPLLRCDGRDTTVAEMQEASHGVAGALRSWGIERGDRAAIMMSNVPEFVPIWFGILRAGAVEVPVHSAHKGPLLEHILGESGARVLFCDAEFVPRLEGLDLSELERIVVRGELPGEGVPAGLAVHPLEEALAAAPAAGLPQLAVGDVSCILYTSGTTGRSKGVVLTHGANLRLARANIDLMEYTAADVLYTAFPLFHVNAKFTSLTSALISGARLVLDDRFSASGFWERMREERVTSFNYMGGLLAILAKQPEREGDSDHVVERAYGGACPPNLWQPFEDRFGVRLHEHYGMTEIGIAIQNTRTDRRVGAIGRPAPYFQVRLADDSDREVAVGEVGEIQVRPNEPDAMLLEYWRRPDATTAAFRNLWFHTGDRARADEDGFIYYHDRLTDSIRRRGENVSSFELEAVVASFDGVVECAAYGVPSELGEDEVMVAVVPEPGTDLDLDALLAHCEDRVARFAVPRYVRVMTELPKNSSQRIQKFKLRDEGVTPDTVDRGLPKPRSAGG
ncbi:MAG TPA: AMP-binding protein [Solirubrobacterales bacterium]|nr:AMP-binding protein [Solirubrobacterales bacterium]